MSSVRIPADVDREDRLLADLTARQLLILTVGAAVVGAVWRTLEGRLPAQLLLAVCAVPAAVAVTLCFARIDGLAGDRFAALFVRAQRRPSILVAAPEELPPDPLGLRDRRIGLLRTPVAGLSDDGVVDLGAAGSALVCRSSSLNFGLRTEDEQRGLVATVAGWLNSLNAPVQIVVRAERVDVDGLVREVERHATGLRHPALEAAAREHARFLAALAADRNVLRREVLVVFRDPARPSAAVAGSLRRRADDAAAALGAAGVLVAPLDRTAAAAVLGRAADPEAPMPEAALDWGDGAVVQGGGAGLGVLRLPSPRRRPAGAVAPLVASARVAPRHLEVGDGARRTVAVVGYPHEVRLGWLEPVVTHAGPVDVSVHIEPVPAKAAADRLRRQMARFESSRRVDARRGRLPDPELEASADDARELAHRLARGQGRLFALGLYATVRGSDPEEAAVEEERFRAVLDSLLLTPVPATYRALEGWLTTLPVGLDLLGMRRTVDTEALAAGFAFASAEPSDQGGVLWGLNARTGGVVTWDRFAQPNHNAVVLARSGAGKSYLTKLELLRSLYRDVEAVVVDPEDEYSRLAAAVGGVTIRVGSPGVRLNPLDLAEEPDALDRRVMFVHTLVLLLLASKLSPAERAALDRAVLAAYAAKGITGDPRTHRRPAPVLSDVASALAADEGAGRELADRLAPFVTGSHRDLFDGPTTTKPEGHLVVFSLRDLPDEMKGAGVLIVLDALWRRVTDPTRRTRRLVVVDEGWWLMRDEAGARFLYKLAKSARKHWCGLTVTTQDAADVLGSDLGQAVVANAATQVLLRQSPQAVPALAEAFRLSEGEQRFLLAARRGEGLLLGGTDRIAFRSVGSPAEHPLVTTDPAELLDLEDAA